MDIRTTRLTKIQKTVDTDGVVGEKYFSVGYTKEGSYEKLYDDLFYDEYFELSIELRNVWIAMISKMDYRCIVDISKEKRKIMADLMGIKIGTFDHYMWDLLKTGIAFSVGGKECLMNPHLVGKGYGTDMEAIRSCVKLNFNGDWVFIGLKKEVLSLKQKRLKYRNGGKIHGNKKIEPSV